MPSVSKKDKPLTKAQLTSEIASKSGLSKAQVKTMVDAMESVIAKELKAGRKVGLFGLAKISTVHKPATKARPGRNPFTGESIMIKAKPARKQVKIRALKGLKDLV